MFRKSLILLILGVLLIANTIYLLLTSNPHMGHVFQFIVALSLIIYSIFNEKIDKKIRILINLFSLLPLGIMAFLFIYGNHQQVDFQEEVVIVLGAGLRGSEVTPHLSRRLDRTVDYFRKNPHVYIIVCGGLGERQLITEAEAMESYLISKGIPPSRIIREPYSTSTYENLLYAKEILRENFSEEVRVALITNDFHIYRATALAESLGLDVYPLGASTPLSSWVLNYLRETVAVLRWWIF